MAKKQGFVVYFDDLDTLEAQMEGDAASVLSVIKALAAYAQTGRVPERGELSPMAAMAFALLRQKVDKNNAAYAEKVEQTRAAARTRWEKKAQVDAAASTRTRTHMGDADACKRKEQELEQELELEHELEHELEQEAVVAVATCARGQADGGDSGGGDFLIDSASRVGTAAQATTNQGDIAAIQSAFCMAGVPFKQYERGEVTSLLKRYSACDICKAAGIAAERDRRNMGFIKGVLRRGVDSGKQPAQGAARDRPVKEVSQHRYTQRAYTSSDYDALVFDIMADKNEEAEKK